MAGYDSTDPVRLRQFGMPTKVYWWSPDGNDVRTTIIPEPFRPRVSFKLEAVAEPNQDINYGYVLLGLRK